MSIVISLRQSHAIVSTVLERIPAIQKSERKNKTKQKISCGWAEHLQRSVHGCQPFAAEIATNELCRLFDLSTTFGVDSWIIVYCYLSVCRQNNDGDCECRISSYLVRITLAIVQTLKQRDHDNKSTPINLLLIICIDSNWCKPSETCVQLPNALWHQVEHFHVVVCSHIAFRVMVWQRVADWTIGPLALGNGSWRWKAFVWTIIYI